MTFANCWGGSLDCDVMLSKEWRVQKIWKTRLKWNNCWNYDWKRKKLKKLHYVICELTITWTTIKFHLWSKYEGFQRRLWKKTQFYSFYYLQHYRFPFWITQLYYSCPRVIFWGILSAITSPVKAIENCKTFTRKTFLFSRK